MRTVLKSILFLSIILISTTLVAQTPDTLWTKTYGGPRGDAGYSVQQTSDGGYIITGRKGSISGPEREVWLIKTDASGNTLWTKIYGGDYEYGIGHCVEQTYDGGYIIGAGYGGVGHNETEKIWLIKTDTAGDTLWTKTFSGYLADYIPGKPVQQTSDGGYIVAAYTKPILDDSTDVLLIKTDASGDMLWTKTYDGNQIDMCQSVQQTNDGGYIMTGYTNGYLYAYAVRCDLWLIKTDTSGDISWTKTFVNKGNDINVGTFVQQTSDSGYIVAGYTKLYGYHSDIWLIKTDAAGDTLWTQTFGDSLTDEGCSVQQISDSGYIVTGKKTNYYGASRFDLWLIKTDALGDILWTQTFGGNQGDIGRSAQQTSDGGYIVTGTKDGPIGGAPNTGDVWLIKIDSDPTHVENKIPNFKPTEYLLNQNYPNPFNPSTQIKFSLPKSEFTTLKVFNILGREVTTLVSRKLNQGNHTYTFDGNELASGIYYYQLVAGEYREVRKMILLR